MAFTAHDKEILELSVYEGHDADLASNAGAIDPKTGHATTSSSFSESHNETDVEKGGQAAGHREGTGNEKVPEVHEAETTRDSNIVDWEGPDDPTNPMNWSTKRKIGAVAILALLSFVTPLASSMFAPGVPQVMRDFGSSSNVLAGFVVSVYLLGFACGPLIVSPMAELYGRWYVYQITNLFFVIFTVACALSTSLGMLIGMRFIAGCFGCAPVTIGGGSIADMIPQERRGAAMAMWAMGPLMGPVIGPVIGGYLAGARGWRWVFWLIAIASGVFAVACLFLTEETYAPVLLERKAARLRKETGNSDLRSKLASDLSSIDLFKRAIGRPAKMLTRSPIVFLMSLYMSTVYGILYLLFTTFTFVFEDIYGFSQNSVGLVYLGTGIGLFIGLFALGLTSDRIMKALAKKNGGEMKPEYRLPPLSFGGVCLCVGLFIYGWSAENHVQWAVPLLGTLFIGIGTLLAFMCVQTYLIDAFTVYAASAVAANTVMRSMFGAFLPLAGLPMYKKLGYGWGNSLLGFVAFAMIPIPLLFYRYGERIRTSKKYAVTF